MSAEGLETIRNIVLVHGGFVDGSGWEGVYRRLRKQGFTVSVVQNPTTSLGDDLVAVERVLAQQGGRAILVGHSYGGVVITEAGNHPKVAGLVYIAAFAPDSGESVASLIKDPPPGAPVPPILPPGMGICCWTRRSSLLRSRATSPQTWLPSWRTRSFPGGLRRSRAASPSQPGNPSRAGISCPRTTG